MAPDAPGPSHVSTKRTFIVGALVFADAKVLERLKHGLAEN